MCTVYYTVCRSYSNVSRETLFSILSFTFGEYLSRANIHAIDLSPQNVVILLWVIKFLFIWAILVSQTIQKYLFIYAFLHTFHVFLSRFFGIICNESYLNVKLNIISFFNRSSFFLTFLSLQRCALCSWS